MCNPACIRFALDHIGRLDVEGKSVLEVGSYNVNGSLRDHICYFGPASYLGVDAAAGPGVDQVCRVENLLSAFGAARFDLIVSTEMLEHVAEWRPAVRNLKECVKPWGKLVITTRSYGFPLHQYPDDYWRFETYDLQHIFADFHIETLMKDPSEPGVFLKAIRPEVSSPADLDSIFLFSMKTHEREAVQCLHKTEAEPSVE
jgi:SAM-dependent methyltransferase